MHNYETQPKQKRPEKGIIDDSVEEKKTHDHHTEDVMICGAFSGAVAALLTNGLETLAVKKQTKRNFSIIKHLRKPGAIRSVMFKGVVYRTYYYGFQAFLLFLLLEKLKVVLDVVDMED